MLRITQVATANRNEPLLFRLEGQVRGPWVDELRRVCEETVGENGRSRHRLVLDLAEVLFVDARGVVLFRELTALNVVLTNCSPFVAEQLNGVANGDR